jgi:hypothetical protein
MNPKLTLKNFDPLYCGTEDTRRNHGQRVHYKFAVAEHPNSFLDYHINDVSWSHTHRPSLNELSTRRRDRYLENI